MNMHIAVLLAGILVLGLAAGCDKKDSSSSGEGTQNPPAPTISSSVPLPPPKPKAEIEVQGVAPEEEVSIKDHLRVDGVLKQGAQYTAAINNQVVSIGDFMKLQVRSRQYNLEVLSISDERVLLKAVVTP